MALELLLHHHQAVYGLQITGIDGWVASVDILNETQNCKCIPGEERYIGLSCCIKVRDLK